jgi:hypothetical protein
MNTVGSAPKRILSSAVDSGDLGTPILFEIDGRMLATNQENLGRASLHEELL